MTSRRVWTNLVVFVLVTGLLAWWVGTTLFATTVGRPTPTVLTAHFDASAGLQPLFEVTYRGHRVGRIGELRLEPDSVAVALEIDEGVTLPDDLVARIRNRSVVGEPYVDLRPAPADAPGEPTARTGVIPLARTALPPSYADSLTILNELLVATDPDDLATLSHELAATFDGHGTTLRDMLLDVERLTTTFADRADVLDRAVVQLGQLTPLLAAHAADISSSIEDVEQLAAAVRAGQDDLIGILEGAPAALGRSTDLLRATSDPFGCMAVAVGTAGERLAAEALPQLVPVLRILPQVLVVLRDVTVQGEGGLWLRASSTLNTIAPLQPTGGNGPLPEPPPLTGCG